MSSCALDVKELYFEHKVFTRIVGESTFDTLQKMLLQIKTNASSVPCTLDGGAQGFVGVVLSPTTYATLDPMTLFVAPTPPGILTGPVSST